MKQFVVAAVVALGACSNPSDTPDNEVASQDIVETPEPAATFMDGGPAYGTFEVTSNDGTVLTQALAEDGTQTTTDADGTVVEGKFTSESPERYCRMDGEETEWTCYTEAMSADGVWTATNEADPNEVWTIRRVE